MSKQHNRGPIQQSLSLYLKVHYRPVVVVFVRFLLSRTCTLLYKCHPRANNYQYYKKIYPKLINFNHHNGCSCRSMFSSTPTLPNVRTACFFTNSVQIQLTQLLFQSTIIFPSRYLCFQPRRQSEPLILPFCSAQFAVVALPLFRIIFENGFWIFDEILESGTAYYALL